MNSNHNFLSSQSSFLNFGNQQSQLVITILDLFIYSNQKILVQQKLIQPVIGCMYEQSLRKYPPYHLPKVIPKQITKAQVLKHQKINHYRNKSLVDYLLSYTQNEPVIVRGRRSNKNIVIVQKPAIQKLRYRKIKTQSQLFQKQFKHQLSSMKKQVRNLSIQLKEQKDSRFTEQMLQKLARKNKSLSSVNTYTEPAYKGKQSANQISKSAKFSFIKPPISTLILQQSQHKYESLTKKIQDIEGKKKIYYTSKNYKGRYKMVSKFKKVGNAILFLIYLRRYREKMIFKKLNYFRQNTANQIHHKILKIKQIFTNSVFKFLQKITWKHQLNLVISIRDSRQLMVQKYTYTRKYVNVLLDYMSELQFNKTSLQKIIQPTYFLCKHGNFGVHYSFYTQEELSFMCIAEQQYVRADKNLEKSQIITLLFIKIFLFNMILRPWKMNEIEFDQKSINNKNLILIGGIIYRLAREVQLDYLKIANNNYAVGNWKDLNANNQRKYIQNNAKYNKVKGCKSMILQNQFYHDNDQMKEKTQDQLIFGVLSKKYADQYYNIIQWKPQRKKIISIVNLIHSRICHYHKIIAKKCL